jgi:hypothetical protein
MNRRGRTATIVLAILLPFCATAFVFAQDVFRGFGLGGRRGPMTGVMPNVSYDGKFTFVRLRYGPPTAYVGQSVPWSHDYPTGERHFMKIMNEVSYLSPHLDETNILAFDDPELAKYPVAYLCEPGDWVMTDGEAAAMRAYLLKGGFLIVDDFRYFAWGQFEEQMRRILPTAQFIDLEATNPIFHSFFEINSFDEIPNYYDQQYNFNGGRPVFRAIYQDNDPTKRMLVMINYNTDISEFWEFSDTGFKPIDESNEAYKLGVNYVMYGMTH